MKKPDRQLNTENKQQLAPSEVEVSNCLSGDSSFSASTSLGGKKTELDYPNLKLLLKDLAKQIIKQTYEEIRNSGSNLY